MKVIKLTQGKVALVDDEDFEYLNQWKWYASFDKRADTFYASRTLHGLTNKTIRMHRVIMGIEDRSILVDHIDHNGLHNCRSNIRVATPGQNCANVRAHKGGTSEYLGVSWNKQNNKWRVVIQKDRKQIRLGHFIDEQEAALCYNKKAIEIHGDFANLNVLEKKAV